MDLDVQSLKIRLQQASSAMQAATIADEMEQNQRLINEINRQNAERNATLVAGAEANIAQKELLEQQFETIKEQNELLADNYNKLKEMYDAQIVSYKDAKEDLRRSRRFNIGMMVISIIAMLAAIAGPIITLLVS